MADSNYNKYERETVINMCDADKTATIESYQRYWILRILKLKEKAPNDVQILAQTDKKISAVIPVRFLRLAPPRTMSEDAKEKARIRLIKWREEHNLPVKSPTNNSEDDELDDELLLEDMLEDEE